MKQREEGNRRKYPISASLSVSNFIKIHIFVTDSDRKGKNNEAAKFKSFFHEQFKSFDR